MMRRRCDVSIFSRKPGRAWGMVDVWLPSYQISSNLAVLGNVGLTPTDHEKSGWAMVDSEELACSMIAPGCLAIASVKSFDATSPRRGATVSSCFIAHKQ